MKAVRKKSASAKPAHLARSVDHLVLPAASTEIARERYSRLGFTVAPDGVHPFGTENCCIYLPDGTFLEPLGVAQREICEEQAKKGNFFVARDQAYRFRRGQDGFSAIAVASGNAKKDLETYAGQGLAGGEMVSFSRKFVQPKGDAQKVSFRLACAADLRSPDFFLFSCEWRGAAADRSKLERHANGARSLRSVILSEPNPSDFQYTLQTVFDRREVNSDSFGIELAAGNCEVAAYTPAGIMAWFGAKACAHARGLRGAGFVLGVPKLDKTREALAQGGVEFREMHGRLIVDAAPGQGCFIAFAEGK
jgi:hypothetical protein